MCTLCADLCILATQTVKWCMLTRCPCERCVAGKIEGDVRVSGYPKVQETFARIMGYVEQSDIHSPNVSLLPCPPVQCPHAAHTFPRKLMEIWCAILQLNFFCCTCALGGHSLASLLLRRQVLCSFLINFRVLGRSRC